MSRGVRSELVLGHLGCVSFSLAAMVCPEVDDVVRTSAFDVGEQVALVMPCAGNEIAQEYVKTVGC